MKINTNVLVKSIVGVVLIGAALTLLQIWFDLFVWIIFWKLIATLVIIGSVVSFIIAVMIDMGDQKKLKDEKYLD